MNKRAWWSAVAFASVVSATGCGGDDGTGSPAQGASGLGGPVVAAGTGGGAAGMGATGVPCGTATCMGLSLPGIIPAGLLPTPCCADQVMGTCGMMSNGACRPPLPPAPNCPVPRSPTPLIMLRACCDLMTNRCGIDGSALGMGCVAGSLPGAMPPPPTMCDGTPAPPPVGGLAGAGASGAAAAGMGGGAGTAGAAGGAGGAMSGAGGASGGAGGASGGAAFAGRGASGASAAGAGGGGAGGRGF